MSLNVWITSSLVTLLIFSTRERWIGLDGFSVYIYLKYKVSILNIIYIWVDISDHKNAETGRKRQQITMLKFLDKKILCLVESCIFSTQLGQDMRNVCQ